MIKLIIAAAIALLPACATAQMMPCGARADIVERLGQKYGETRRGGGLSGPTAVIELYASEKTGSWTILRTTPSGMSCVMAVGESWQSDEPVPAGDPT